MPYALAALLSTGVGLALGTFFASKRNQPAEAAESAPVPKPWFKIQGAPPETTRVKPRRVLPEHAPDDRGREDRPVEPFSSGVYEEPPPETVYHAPEVVVPMGEGSGAEVSATATEKAVSVDAALRPWERNALPFVPALDQPMIAIVIDDMGLDLKRTRQVLDLQGPLTVSYLTYADNLRRQTAEAWSKGHEVMAHVPMEPGGASVDPGPNVLLVTHDAATIKARLTTGLDEIGRIVGINNHMGSKFTANAEAMSVVMEVLAERGLLFLDSRTSSKTTGPSVAKVHGVPLLVRNVFLDNDNNKEAVLKNLVKTENIAEKHGFAIAIGHPRSATIAALTEWIAVLPEKGMQLAPATAILKQRRAARLAEKARSLDSRKE